MPTLDELKEKWFLDVSSIGYFPPQIRHDGTQIKACTDGNLLEPLIDGSVIMADFHQRLNNMINSAYPSQHELWISSYRLDPVKLLGSTKPEKDAEAKILEAADAGVKVYYLGSGHVSRGAETEEFARKLKAKGSDGTSDRRFPKWGSHHQKFNVFRGPAVSQIVTTDWVAVVGSADLSFLRWDTPDHFDNNPDRPEEGGPTHDIAVRVRGPAVHDIALTFTERWNNTANRNLTNPEITTSIPTNFLSTQIPSLGTQSVQVLRTYPIEPDRGYTWSNKGEFTIWAAYLNAIRKAEQYIYIEEQFFYSFNVPPAIQEPPFPYFSLLRDTDLIYQLGQRLKRGVDVIVLVPRGSEDFVAEWQLHHRGVAAHYLRNIADSHSDYGHFVICSLRVGESDPIVHSKLLIADDEFVLIGTANICQRSIGYDSEIHLGIVDSANVFARQLRLDLWQEHMELTNSTSIIDPSEGVEVFREYAQNELGRLRLYPSGSPGPPPLHYLPHETCMNNWIDPYKGPDRR